MYLISLIDITYDCQHNEIVLMFEKQTLIVYLAKQTSDYYNTPET